MTNSIDRRHFMGTALATGACSVVPRHVLGGNGYVAPNDKITLAHIGMGTQGFNELGALLEDPRVQIVAVCDPNRDSNNYIEWGKGSNLRRIRQYLDQPSWREGQEGCPGGREVGREVIDTYYTNHRDTGSFKACKAYADFRELLATEKDLDAVKIMTPDHLHATIAIASMQAGKHVLMHKPLANRLAEGRKVIDTVRKTKRATHLMAYGVGVSNELIVDQIKQGAIGTLREVHNWSNRPVWPQYTSVPTDHPPVPDGFDWDLWLGSAKERPYHPHYTHTVFRGWYDFGGGSMADMGIYSLWPVFTGLGLDVPVSADATGSHSCSIADHVSRKVKNDFSYPMACAFRLKFANRESTPGIDLFWYDGGMQPRLPREIESHHIAIEPEGILFIGDEGAILAGFMGQSPQLFANGKVKPLVLDDSRLQSVARHAPWVDACLGGEPSPGCFENAAAITDAVNLATVALRCGKKVEFDSDHMKVTNIAAANQYLDREYRKGWEL